MAIKATIRINPIIDTAVAVSATMSTEIKNNKLNLQIKRYHVHQLN
jgi:hypothetical protein